MRFTSIVHTSNNSIFILLSISERNLLHNGMILLLGQEFYLCVDELDFQDVSHTLKCQPR